MVNSLSMVRALLDKCFFAVVGLPVLFIFILAVMQKIRPLITATL